MLYSQTDREQVTAERTKRLLVVLIPTVLMVLLSIASFVWYRLHRDTGGWFVTGMITVLAGVYFIFFQSVYLRPVSLYKRHVEAMLNGRKHELEGFLKSVDIQAQDHEELDCRTLVVNIGEKGLPEDDRLFYMDALKPMPEIALGTRVKVISNDRMVASIQPCDPHS
jgi:hypothetical protein